MEVDHRGFDVGVAEIFLNDAQVNAGFQQVGSIRMAQGVDRDALLADAGGAFCSSQSALDAFDGHGNPGMGSFLATPADSGKNELRVSVGDPITTQQGIGCFGKGNIAILGALAPVDMDHPSLAIDIGDFQKKTFLEAQTAGINGHQVGIVVEGTHQRQNLFDFVSGEHGGKPSFPARLGDGKQMPVFFEDVFEEELNAGITDAHGSGTPAGDVLPVDEIVEQFVFRDEIRAFVVMLD